MITVRLTGLSRGKTIRVKSCRNDAPAVESPEALADSVEDYLKEHYQEEVTLATLSALFHYDAAYLSRIYKRYKGQSPGKALTALRIAGAKVLITERRELDLKDIAVRVGYRDHHYFSRVFKKVTGMSPRDCRRDCENRDDGETSLRAQARNGGGR